MIKPLNICLFSDAGRDIDDELALVATAHAHRIGLVSLKAVIANLKPAEERALLIKGTLQELGLGWVPVAVGEEVNGGIKHTEYETMVAYKAARRDLSIEPRLLEKTLLLSADQSNILVLLSGMTDARKFIEANPDLVKAKVAKVVIMGGVETKNDAPVLDGDGHLVPDSSYNNNVDPESAAKLYKDLQRLAIPVTVVSRHAVYPVGVDHNFFKAEAATSRVAKRVKTRHEKYISDFWKMVNMDADHPERVDFPARMTREWFIGKFTDASQNTIDALNRGEPVVNFIEKMNLYDVVALMAAIHHDRADLFVPVTYGNFSVVGLSEKYNGIADADLVKNLMQEHILNGFAPQVSLGAGPGR